MTASSASLRGMTWDHPRAWRGLEAVSTAHERATGVSIAWDRRSLQDFADAPIDELAETYDLIVLDHPHVGLIADAACLLPLPMPEDGASLGGSLESYVWRDRLWALPIDAACQVAVERPDLVEHRLPDWQAALDAEPADYRLITPLLPVDAFDMMMTLVASRGETDLPHSPERFTSEGNGLLALKVLKALYRLGPSDAVEWNPIRALEALSTTDEFHASPCLFGYVNYAAPGFRDHVLAYRDLPGFRGGDTPRAILGGAGLGVSARTAHPDEAVAFARRIASEAVQAGLYLENEGQPAHPGAWDKGGDDPRHSGFLKGARRTIDNAWTRPRDPWFLGFVDDVCAIMPDLFLRDRDEASFLAEIDALYRKHRGTA